MFIPVWLLLTLAVLVITVFGWTVQVVLGRNPFPFPDPGSRIFSAASPAAKAAIVELRQYQPVIGLVAGPVGCFGGMSIAAGLCSYLLVTREARLGLNGPQVIEQEAGLDEYDSRDRPFIWSLTGGEQRFASGLVDRYVADDVAKIRQQVGELLQQGLPKQPRSQRAEWFLQKLSSLNTDPQIEPSVVRDLYQGERS